MNYATKARYTISGFVLGYSVSHAIASMLNDESGRVPLILVIASIGLCALTRGLHTLTKRTDRIEKDVAYFRSLLVRDVNHN